MTPQPNRLMLIIDNLDFGGAQRLIEIQVEVMARKRCVIVINLASATSLSERLPALGAEVISAEINRLSDIRDFLKLAKSLSPWAPDLIHSHLIHATLFGSVFAMRLGVPHVVTLHNEAPNPGGTLTQLKNRLEQYVLSHRTDAVIACGPRVARLQSARVGETFLSTVRNRVKSARSLTSAERAKNRKAANIQDGDIVIFAAGRLHRQKGFDILLDAFATICPRHPQALLWIAGDGEERDALYQQAVRLGILDRVRLLGAVADVESRLQIADIFVLSSRYEGLPMVLLEAMDAALPIVATRVGDIDTVIGEEAALLIDPECKEHLASALSRVVSDRILRNRLGSRAYDASLPYTDVPGFIAELEGIYSVAMQAPRGAD